MNGMPNTSRGLVESGSEEGRSIQTPQGIIEAALALPGVTWAVLYGCPDKAQEWESRGQGGPVPNVLQDLALPGDRLPLVVTRALHQGTIEQSRFFSVWLRSELGRDPSEPELDALSSVIAIPLYLSPDMTAFLLLGCRDRDPHLPLFEAFRAQIEDAATQSQGFNEQELAELAAGQESGGPLVAVYRLLDREVAVFHAFLAIEMKRSVRYQRNLSLLTFTVRHPRIASIAETVMLGVAQTLRSRLRSTDTVGRADQHVIGVVLPEISEGTARWLSPRLRLAVLRYLATVDRVYTVEIGVAARPRPHDKPEDLIAQAVRHVIEAPLALRYHVSCPS